MTDLYCTTGTSPPLCVTRQEAAAKMGISLRHFELEVQPHIKLLTLGRRKLVPMVELEKFIRLFAE